MVLGKLWNQAPKTRYFQDAEDNVKKLVPEGIVGEFLSKA